MLDLNSLLARLYFFVLGQVLMMGTNVQIESVPMTRALTSLGLIAKAPSGSQANGVTLVHQALFGVHIGAESDRRIKKGKISMNTHFMLTKAFFLPFKIFFFF